MRGPEEWEDQGDYHNGEKDRIPNWRFIRNLPSDQDSLHTQSRRSMLHEYTQLSNYETQPDSYTMSMEDVNAKGSE
jgi:aldehyde:ferredoxin oxidoreductase